MDSDVTDRDLTTPMVDLEAGHPAPDTKGRRHQSDFRSRMRSLFKNKWVLRLIAYSAIALAFQIMAMIQGPFFLPEIPDIVLGVGELFTDGYVLTLVPTLQQLAIGFFITVVIAIPMGALMGRYRSAEDLLAPWVNTLFVTPKAALLPIIILVFGLGLEYRVLVVILFAIFFPVINTAAGVRYVDRELRETAEAFATPPWRMFTQIYLPAAAPFIVAGSPDGSVNGDQGHDHCRALGPYRDRPSVRIVHTQPAPTRSLLRTRTRGHRCGDRLERVSQGRRASIATPFTFAQ